MSPRVLIGHWICGSGMGLHVLTWNGSVCSGNGTGCGCLFHRAKLRNSKIYFKLGIFVFVSNWAKPGVKKIPGPDSEEDEHN